MGNRNRQMVISQTLEAKIRDLIIKINSAIKPDGAISFYSGIFFMRSSEGVFKLDQEETQMYEAVLRTIVDQVCTNRLISRKFAGHTLQTAIFETLDISKKRREKIFEQRLDFAIENFKRTLTQASHKFVYYYPIEGLNPEGLPIRIGDIEIFVIQEEHLHEIYRLSPNDAQEGKKQSTYQLVSEIKEQGVLGKIFSRTVVEAVDKEAAEEIALQSLQKTLEIINFFGDLTPYTNGFAYLPGTADRTRIYSFLRNPVDDLTQTNTSLVGSVMPISFEVIKQADQMNEIGFQKLMDIISKPINDLQNKIITAIRWAGKGIVHERLGRNEDAFLHFAIALESLILLDQKTELNYRLSIRLAHLLGKSGEYRPGIAKQIRELYEIRSQIVHSGNFDIADVDLASIRFITRSTIVHLIRNEPFASMKTSDELVKWFDQQIFG